MGKDVEVKGSDTGDPEPMCDGVLVFNKKFFKVKIINF